MSVRNYLITVDDQAAAAMEDLTARLRLAGFEVVSRLDAIGIVLGRIDEASVQRIRSLPGVSAIDEERAIGPSS